MIQCKHYTGVPAPNNITCKKDKLYPCDVNDSPTARLKGLPCLGVGECDGYQPLTPTALGKAKKAIEQRQAEFDILHLTEKIRLQVAATKEFTGYMPCPVCGELAEYGLSRYSGQIKLVCSTEKCVNIVEGI